MENGLSEGVGGSFENRGEGGVENSVENSVETGSETRAENSQESAVENIDARANESAETLDARAHVQAFYQQQDDQQAEEDEAVQNTEIELTPEMQELQAIPLKQGEESIPKPYIKKVGEQLDKDIEENPGKALENYDNARKDVLLRMKNYRRGDGMTK